MILSFRTRNKLRMSVSCVGGEKRKSLHARASARDTHQQNESSYALRRQDPKKHRLQTNAYIANARKCLQNITLALTAACLCALPTAAAVST